jgi:hypothetical protein
MSSSLLPAYFTPNIAAILTGRSARQLRAQIRRGELAANTTGAWARIPASEIVRVRDGRPIDIAEYLAAIQRRARRAHSNISKGTSTSE